MELSDAVLDLQDQVNALKQAKKGQDKELATLKQELANMKASKPASGPSVDVAALTRQIKAELDREISPLRAEISQLRQAQTPIPLVETKPTGRSLPVPLYLVALGFAFFIGLIIWGVSSTNSAKIVPAAAPITQPAPVSRPVAKTSKPKPTVQKRRSSRKETDDQKIERINRQIDAMSKELGIEPEPD
jgi:prefoldin subunit 5